MAADETAQQPRRRGRPPGSKSTTGTRRRLDGHELTQQLNGMVAELIKENRKLKRQDEEAPQALSLRRGLHLLGRPVCIDDAEEPQPGAAELHRHSNRGPDDAEVQVEAKELQASDADQVRDPLQVVAEVEMPEPWDDRKGGREGRALPGLAVDALICARGGRSASWARRARIGEQGAAPAAQHI